MSFEDTPLAEKQQPVLSVSTNADANEEREASSVPESASLPELDALCDKIKEALPILKRDEEIWARTEALEAKLEEGQAVAPNKKRSTSKALRFAKKSFHSLLLGAAVLGASEGIAEGSEQMPKKSSDTTKHQEVGKRTLTDREWHEKVGLHCNTLARASGFTISLSVDNGKGPYILHIGQTHKTPYNLTNETQRLNVMQSQRANERFISGLIEENSSLTNIFTEGLTLENEKAANGGRTTVRELLELIQPDKECYRKIILVHESVLKMLEATPTPKLTTHLNYLFQKRLTLLDNYFRDYGSKIAMTKNEKAVLQKDREGAYKKLVPVEQLKSFGADAVFYYGGDEKLFLDGKTMRKAAETDATNAAAFEDDDKIARLYEGISRSKTADEVKKLRAFDFREEKAVEIMGQFARTNKAPVIPLVYGSAHRFDKAVDDYNKKHPNQKFGLIEARAITEATFADVKSSLKK